MIAQIAYDIYRGTNDRTLRLATLPGAGLPAHLKRKDWMLMPAGKSPVHSDSARDVAVQGYCLFQVVAGK
jgi:DNA-binding XRE family transcriptional regulator